MTGTQAVPSSVNFPCINPSRRAGPQEESNELSAAAVRSNEQSDNRTRARAPVQPSLRTDAIANTRAAQNVRFIKRLAWK